MEFASELAAWHDFYLLLGGACATLVGLVFVAVTLNIDRLRGESGGSTLQLAERAFGYFLVLVVLSLVQLMPDLTPTALATALICMGAAGLLRGIVRLRRGLPGTGWRGQALPTAAFALLVACGVLLLRGDLHAFGLTAAPVFLLLVQSVSESWRILVLFRQGGSASA